MIAKSVATIALLLLPSALFCQSHFNESAMSPEVLVIIGRLARHNVLTSSFVGIAGVRTKQYDDFEELSRVATTDELIALTEHPNGVVRSYAVWALARGRTVDLVPILARHIDDTVRVRTARGCIGGGDYVGDAMIDAVRFRDIAGTDVLSTEALARLDSVLIFRPNVLWARDWALDRAKPNEDIYARVRELATEADVGSALVLLAKYRREADIPVILNTPPPAFHGGSPDYFYTFAAIAEFPHPAFFSLLEKKLYEAIADSRPNSGRQNIYAAIVSYRNVDAARLLRFSFTKLQNGVDRRDHMQIIFHVLHAMRDSLYDEFLWELWEREHLLTPGIYEYLGGIDSMRAYRASEATLRSPESLSVGDVIGQNYDMQGASVEERLLRVMLEAELRHDRAAAYELIRANLGRARVGRFIPFAEMACATGDTLFAGPLLERLEIEEEPNIYVRAAEVLLSYRNAAINERLREVRMRNPNLSDGLWAKEIDRLMKRYGEPR